MKNLIVVLLALCLTQHSKAQTTNEPIQNALQTLLDELVDNRLVFGTTVNIKKGDSSFVWEGSAGDLTQATPYFIASTTKLYVTAVILKLKADGKLNLDDKINQYLDKNAISKIHIYNKVDYSQELTIRQLLSQTSGLPDYMQDKRLSGSSLEKELMQGKDQQWNWQDVMNIVRTDMKTLFAPDTPKKAHYSDTNYQLLGAIIEAITKQPVAEALETYVFKPLYLKETYLYADRKDNTPVPLYFKDKPLAIPRAMVSFGADGGIVSTANESMIFLEAFFNGKLFPKEYLNEIQQHWNKIFYPLQYGTGITKFELPKSMTGGITIPALYGHSGLSGAFAYYCPELDIYLTGTVNQISKPSTSYRLMINLLATIKTLLPTNKPYQYEPSTVWSPVIGYTPETNFVFGVNTRYLFKPKNTEKEVRTSYLQATSFYTLNKQIVVNGDFNIFTKDEKWNFTGFAQYAFFPLYYYGIGNNSPEETKELYESQSLELNSQAMRKIAGKWYAGIGYRYVKNYNFKIKESGLLETDKPFGWNGSQSSGVQMLLRHDSRNNIINASKGWYLNLVYSSYFKSLGGSSDYQKIALDVRTYYSFNKEKPYKNILAAQLYTENNTGTIPFTDLALLGGSAIMRGYYTGRFRDNFYFAFQTEYRHAFNNSFGFTAFAGMGQVQDNWKNFSVSSLKPNAGMGFRYSLLPKERLNLRLDYGVGKSSSNIYVTFSEAF